MARSQRTPAPDQAQRDAAVVERAGNVLIDAGAGTGKTTILVDRLVQMVAPTNGAPAVPIERLAAITFTRKAAGELRLRVRERLLDALAEPGITDERGTQLRTALAGLDTAYVGTIHSFADRLLRLRPVEAELSPSYEIAEDGEDLIRETFDVLLHAVQNGTLAAELAGTDAASRADEMTRTLLFALSVGLRAESFETEWYVFHGLDSLVAGFIRDRDVQPPDVDPPGFDAAAFHAVADELVRLAEPLCGDAPGIAWIQRMAAALHSLRGTTDPLVLLRVVRQHLERKPRKETKRDTFAGDNAAWQVWKRLTEGNARQPTSLLEDLTAPLNRWIATRLARLFPVAVALYEKVKARNRALDQLDLLVKLRDLLARDRAIRGEYQRMFDHIFVDEFQDTDPLQAEIILFLCEREPVAAHWDDVVLRDRSLTIVGDPKQSIYRFRRADIAIYDRVRQIVARGPHLPVQLSASFRSVPPLIQWLNDRFDRVLGLAPDDRRFDPATGRVFQKRLLPGRAGVGTPAVHVLPFDFIDGAWHRADKYRKLEAETLAKYLRWLVEASDVLIEDPLDPSQRRVGYGDIAILAVSTWQLPFLFAQLDVEGVPYASRGGKLFLTDPLHRQFLLGLRALADRDDGVAEAALLRPPFFAVDPADLLREQTARKAGQEPADEGAQRAREARELVRTLRQRRFEHPPGATARDLLEHTGLARAVALGPNGVQRLARLRELCLLLEQHAADEGLDYDGATAHLREWVLEPIQIDPPHPAGTEAVQVLTVHQAKGLEFPVIVLWDGKGQWDTRLDLGPWRMERDGAGWLVNLDGLSWEEPVGLNLCETEHAYLDAERKRVIYVAATRARDLLVIPRAGEVAPGKIICADLLAGADPALVRELEPYRAGIGSSWAQALEPPRRPEPADDVGIEGEVAARWAAASTEAARPRFRPASVSGEAHAVPRDEPADEGERVAAKPREGRFGSLFGSTVHHAVGLALRDGALTVQEAVRRAAERLGLDEHRDEAVADVSRALDALRVEGLVRPLGPDLRLEYPVAGAWDGGQLLSGYVDIVGATADRLDVIDLKTDAPPPESADEMYPQYTAQVRIYGRLLDVSGMVGQRRLHHGLLFTADGVIRWVEPR